MTLLRPPHETRIKAVQNGIARTDEGSLLLHDLEGREYGGGPRANHSRDARSLWTRKEKKEYRDFMRLYRKGDYVTMLARFGTTKPDELENRLNVEMQADPRLTVQTRRGVIYTSVEQQKQFGKRFAGPEDMKT